MREERGKGGVMCCLSGILVYERQRGRLFDCQTIRTLRALLRASFTTSSDLCMALLWLRQRAIYAKGKAAQQGTPGRGV